MQSKAAKKAATIEKYGDFAASKIQGLKKIMNAKKTAHQIKAKNAKFDRAVNQSCTGFIDPLNGVDGPVMGPLNKVSTGSSKFKDG